MAGIQESPFYMPAKRNFLEKLQKWCYYHISLCGVKESKDETKSQGLQLLLSPTSSTGRKGFYCSCQGGSFLEGNWAPKLVTWRIICVFWTFFSGGGREQQCSRVSLETLFSSLLFDALPSLPWRCGPSRSKPKRRKALAPIFLSLLLVSLFPTLECTDGHKREQSKGSREVATTTNFREYKHLKSIDTSPLVHLLRQSLNQGKGECSASSVRAGSMSQQHQHCLVELWILRPHSRPTKTESTFNKTPKCFMLTKVWGALV